MGPIGHQGDLIVQTDSKEETSPWSSGVQAIAWRFYELLIHRLWKSDSVGILFWKQWLKRWDQLIQYRTSEMLNTPCLLLISQRGNLGRVNDGLAWDDGFCSQCGQSSEKDREVIPLAQWLVNTSMECDTQLRPLHFLRVKTKPLAFSYWHFLLVWLVTSGIS